MDIQRCVHIMLAGLFIVMPLAVFAGNNGWYVSVEAGRSNFTGMGDLHTPATPSNNTGTEYGISTGYQFNAYFGLETGYINFGKATSNQVLFQAGYYPPLCTPSGCVQPIYYDTHSTLRSRGWTLVFRGTLPITKKLSMSAYAGGIEFRSELSTDYAIGSNNDGFVSHSTSLASNNLTGTYGIDLNWTFASHWITRLGWHRYLDLGNSSGMGTYNINIMSLGIVYHFE